MATSVCLFSGVVHYRSNEIGMKFELLEELNFNQNKNIEYILEVESLGDYEHRKLLYQGSEIKRWETLYYNNRKIKEEKEFKDNFLYNIKSYDRKARLNYEEVYSDGVLKQKTIYHYSGDGRLSHTETFDNSGAMLSRKDYSFTDKGMLRKVKHTKGDGNKYFSSFVYSKDKVIEEIFFSGNQMTISFYNDNKPSKQEIWDNEKIVNIKTYSYKEKGNILSSIREEDFITGLETEKIYNNEGQVIKEFSRLSDNLIKELEYSYDKEGRKKKLNIKSDRGTEEWIYSYNEQGDINQEEYYLKGVIVKKTIYTDDNSYYEELYREEELIIRIYYEDDKKIREEIIKKGKVLKVRDLKNKL